MSAASASDGGSPVGGAARLGGQDVAGDEAEEEEEEEDEDQDGVAVSHSINTRDFLKSMRRAHRNSLQKLEECQQAAKQSPARQQAVKVNMSSVYTSVGAAQVGSSLARRMVQPVRNNRFWDNDKDEDGGQSMSSVVPMYLGHLTLPLPQQRRDQLGLKEAEFTLPGAVEAEEPEGKQPEIQEQEKPSTRGRSAGSAGVGALPEKPASRGPLGSGGIYPSLDLPSSRGKSAGSSGVGGLAANSRPASGSDPSKPREQVLAEKVMSGALASARREQETETPSILENSEVPDSRGVDGLGGLGELDGLESLSDDSAEVQQKQSSDWPPRGPLQRFKAVMQFSEAFKRDGPDAPLASSQARDKKAERGSLSLRPVQSGIKETEVTDPIFGWLNKVFAMTIRTDFQVTSGFPLIVLIALDAIYPERVKWCQVDWDLKYQNAVYKNYAILMVLWKELNMERAREFREGGGAVELDGMPSASLADKLEFFRRLKRWFEQRIYSTHSTYNAIERRREYINVCRMWGHSVEVPSWVMYEEAPHVRRSTFGRLARAYELMPEYRRLIWFLGSTEHQSM